MSRISIVIPCLDDASALHSCLERLRKPAKDFALEIVVADASTGDDCVEVAAPFGVQFVRCAKGRGTQLNAGAQAASGDVLIFNHADTLLESAHISGLMQTLSDSSIVGGAFYRDIAWQYPWLARFARLSRWYQRRVGILYGDQSVFVRRQTFERLGGYQEIPIMEDIEFSARLRRCGNPIALVDPPLRTSMRRFKAMGYIRNKLQNVCIIWLWRLRLMNPTQIYRWYYGVSPAPPVSTCNR